jgi:FAD:protein FMN transferase
MPGIEAAFTALHQGAQRLDLGNNAKGYAVDQAMAALRAAGATKALVNFGGGNLAITGEPLTLAVRDPESLEAPRWATLRLEETALGTTTSGPRGGTALAATVVARSALEADTLDSEVLALGAEEGLALLVQRGAAGFVLLREDGRKVLRATPGFARAYALEAAPDVTVRE